MTSNILLIHNGRILAEGNVHQIRDLIDEHPHTVYIKAANPRALARRFLADDDVLSLKFDTGALSCRRRSRMCSMRGSPRWRRPAKLAASRRYLA